MFTVEFEHLHERASCSTHHYSNTLPVEGLWGKWVKFDFFTWVRVQQKHVLYFQDKNRRVPDTVGFQQIWLGLVQGEKHHISQSEYWLFKFKRVAGTNRKRNQRKQKWVKIIVIILKKKLQSCSVPVCGCQKCQNKYQ